MSRGGAGRDSLLETALSRASAEIVKTLPGFVDTCHWHACEEPAPRGISVQLYPPGSTVLRKLERVPLCEQHLLVVALTRRVTLKYHPDDVPASSHPEV